VPPNDPGVRPVTVQHSDIDVNGQVNNARYIGWLMDAYDQDFHWHRKVSSCQVNFIGETVRGETLSIKTKMVSETEYTHSIVNSMGEEVCRARLSWSPPKDLARHKLVKWVL